MTVIAGLVGVHAPSARSGCEAMLAGESLQSASPPFYRTLGDAHFGKSGHRLLPEDGECGPLDAGGKILLSADIRLDNRSELIAELSCGPASNLSDSDLLLQSWLRWGEQCLDRLVGDFAFAIWDQDRRRLTLARDPTGQRPLFYALTPEGVAFSSTPAGLLKCPGRAASFAFPNIAASMIGLFPFTPDTLFDGINRVLPGHVAVWTGSGFQQRPYWMPPAEQLRLKPAEYVEAYRHQLDTAVAARMRRHSGRLGTHLSAGYDSSAVAATAARLSAGQPPIAFTCAPRSGFDGPVPPGRLADESPIAALAAEMNGMDHVVVRPSRGALSGLRRIARIYQDPAINLVNMEWWTEIFRQARERGVSTMLVGVMGNLSINASGLSILPQWIRQGQIGSWLAQAAGAAARPDVKWRGVLYNSFEEWLPASLSGKLQSLFRGIPPASEQGFFRREWWSSLPAALPPVPTSVRYPGRLAALRSIDVGLLRKGALADAGIDERDAMADRRLLDFSFALPPEQLLDGGHYHPLARKALADRLPPELLDLRLRGLQGADWYERFDKQEARDMTEELAASHAASQLLDIGRIREAVEQWPSEGTADPSLTILYRMRLLTALATGAFLQEFEADVSS